jgi:hypothetical protein
MAFDATVGGPAATSYLTVAAASLLLQDVLDASAWNTVASGATLTLTATRENALTSATRSLDVQIHWYGTPTSVTQALAWPQTGQSDRYGRPIDPTTIPIDLQLATALYALALLEQARGTGQTQGGEAGIKSKKIGDVTVTYQDAPRAAVATRTTIPAEVRLLLGCFGTVPGVGLIPVLRT